MSCNKKYIVVVLILGIISSTMGQTGTPDSPSIQYAKVISTAFDHLEEGLPVITQAAEKAALQLVSFGGRLLVSNMPEASASSNSFALEAYFRSGGMTMTKYAKYGISSIDSGDVLLIDDLGLDTELRKAHMQQAREAGALVILFGSASSSLSAETDFLIDTGLSPGTAPAVKLDGLAKAICPAAPTANITALWMFTGELVAACTRLGRMPAMFQSVIVPGGRDWLKKYISVDFHADITVDPVSPNLLGSAYLAEIRRCLQGLCDQATSLQAGGEMLATVFRAGGTARIATLGHHLPGQFGLPGDPMRLDVSLTWNNQQKYDVPILLEEIDQGDALLLIGYYDYPSWNDWEPFREIGFPSIWVTGGREVASLIPQPREWEIHIDLLWTFGDCCVTVPGYPIGILPPSGVIQTAALWMIVGEIEKAMLQTSIAAETAQAATTP